MDKINNMVIASDTVKSHAAALFTSARRLAETSLQLQRQLHSIAQRAPQFLEVELHVDDDNRLLQQLSMIIAGIKRSRMNIDETTIKLQDMRRESRIFMPDERGPARDAGKCNDDDDDHRAAGKRNDDDDHRDAGKRKDNDDDDYHARDASRRKDDDDHRDASRRKDDDDYRRGIVTRIRLV